MASDNAAIGRVLRRLRNDIRQAVLKQGISATAKNAGDPRQAAFWDKLAQQEFELKRILRQLAGRQVALDSERTLLWRIPREHRYSARQSLDSREETNLELVELAEITLRELLDFSGDAQTLKPGDWESLTEKIVDFGVNVDKALFHTVVQQLQKGPAFTSALPHPGLGFEHLPALVGMLIAIIASKCRKAP